MYFKQRTWCKFQFMSTETVQYVNADLLTACHVQSHGMSSFYKQQMPQCMVASD